MAESERERKSRLQRVWRANNPARVKAYYARAKQYRRNNPRVVALCKARQRKFNRSPKGIYRVIANRKGGALPLEEFLRWYSSVEKVCVFCDLPERLCGLLNRRGANRRLSIDRKDSSKGYVAGNLQLACLICNRVKNDFFSDEEMRAIAQQFIKPKWELLSLV